jgi:hypothetical protein
MGVTYTEALRRCGIPLISMLGAANEESNSFVKCMGIPKIYESLDAVAKDKDVNVVHWHQEESNKLWVGYRELQLCDAIQQSASEGRWVKVYK